jgi:amino acid adenylation domain-containing protein
MRTVRSIILPIHADLWCSRPWAVRAGTPPVLAESEALRVHLLEDAGSPRLVVNQLDDWSMPLIDFSHHVNPQAAADAWMRSDLVQVVDLARPPLFLYALLKIDSEHFYWYQRYHHIIIDGYGGWLIAQRVADLYTALSSSQASKSFCFNSFGALLENESSYRASERYVQDQEYWLKLLSDMPEPPGLVGSSLGVAVGNPLLRRTVFASAKSTSGIASLIEKYAIGWPQILTASLCAYIHRATGMEDIVVGMPVTARLGKVVRCVPGMVSNIVPLRVKVHSRMSLVELIREVALVIRRALRHQRYRGEDLRRDLGLLARNRNLFGPIVNVMPFDYRLQFHKFRSSTHTIWNGPVTGLSLTVYELADSHQVRLDFAANPVYYVDEDLKLHSEHFLKLLESGIATPDRRIGLLDWMSSEERQLLVEEWNRTEAEYPAEQCIQELFEAQVEQSPEATAVIYGEVQLSYGELNRRANQLAHYLRQLGIQPDDRVALCVERSPVMIVALLAVLKAGGAYVPLDPAYPVERLRFMLEDSTPLVLLTQTHLRSLFPGEGSAAVPVLDLADTFLWSNQAESNPDPASIGLTAQHLAYIIYTSGSTGQPKGVMVQHRNLANLVGWHCAAFSLGAGQRTSSLAGFSFDAATWELWPALCAGAVLVLATAAEGFSAEALLSWWANQELDVSFLPTPIAELAFAHNISSPHLQTLLVGGDRLRQFPVNHPRFGLVNNYGPTETTVVATSGRLKPFTKVLPIGRPIANTQVYILDEYGEPVPIG